MNDQVSRSAVKDMVKTFYAIYRMTSISDSYFALDEPGIHKKYLEQINFKPDKKEK